MKVHEFWELKFQSEGEVWQFEPADSAIHALNFFLAKGVKNVLIPGIGYGRNAKIFYQEGFNITGIEISKSAIELAQKNGLDFPIHHGSVIDMPFDQNSYDGIYCYATLHLFNKRERSKFIQNCGNQLKTGGYMVFAVVSKKTKMFGSGKLISKDRYKINNGLKVFYYDKPALMNEFKNFRLIECREIEEPIKFIEGEEPLKFIMIICQKG